MNTAISNHPPQSKPRILLVDDNPMLRKLASIRLGDAGYNVESAADAEEALEKARRDPPDAVLSDVMMGEVDGFALCSKIREDAGLASVPVILMSSHYGSVEDADLAHSVGASGLVTRTPDFNAELETLRGVLNDKSPRNTSVPYGAVYERHLRINAKQLTNLANRTQSAEERYRTMFENAHDVISLLSLDGTILEANQRWQAVLGVDPASMIGRHIREFSAPGNEEANTQQYRRRVSQGFGRTTPVALRHANGKVVFVEFSLTTIQVDGCPTVLSIGQDVTAEVQAQRALAIAEERYRTLVERIPDAIWTCTVDGTLTFLTPNIANILGYSAAEQRGESLEARRARIHSDDRSAVLEAFQAFVEHGTPFDVEYRCTHKDGRQIWLRNRAIASYEREGVRYVEGMVSDVTERRCLEESFRQAQKMEAIGQLTGGIAHDFNNILSTIITNSFFLMQDLESDDARRTDAEEIKFAAERAAALTRQLLAFSRKQVINPKIIDLNGAVTGLERMLRRLIGEDIEFAVLPEQTLGSVRFDLGQIEQVIMNLVVNARDAMPRGGKLSIETANINVEQRLLGPHSVPPGRYVMLAVSDTGCGMDASTQRRIFEPFFTTKAPGKGTGLGLSTCYGIVQQSGGYIGVYSEPGSGTVFKIYLPRVDEPPTQVSLLPQTNDLNGSETILLIEDDRQLRAAVARVLKGRGYQVLDASDADSALAISKAHQGAIHLILSDVVLPGQNGPETIDALRLHFASARALFMSGYSDHAVLKEGALQVGVNFIQKPFAPNTLAKRVREVLNIG